MQFEPIGTAYRIQIRKDLDSDNGTAKKACCRLHFSMYDAVRLLGIIKYEFRQMRYLCVQLFAIEAALPILAEIWIFTADMAKES